MRASAFLLGAASAGILVFGAKAGVVLHATGQRNLGRLGGLIHRMPWVAWPTLVGVLAIAALPPLNGFVSEWLLCRAWPTASRWCSRGASRST